MASTGARTVFWVGIGLMLGEVARAVGRAIGLILLGRQP
jgi:hypothetical protein